MVFDGAQCELSFPGGALLATAAGPALAPYGVWIAQAGGGAKVCRGHGDTAYMHTAT